MQLRWHHSILSRTGAVLVAVFLVTGAITVGINLQYNRVQAEKASMLRLDQLLDTVESTASVACFTNDEVLANELASGLLRNSEVLSIVIQADDRELVSLRRPADSLDPAAAPSVTPLVREVFSPFTPETRVGRMILTPNQQVIGEAMRQELRGAMLQMALQLVLFALAVAVAMLWLIIRPIKAISDGLHHMDASRGERLPLPAGHQHSEIGLLVEDVNSWPIIWSRCSMKSADCGCNTKSMSAVITRSSRTRIRGCSYWITRGFSPHGIPPSRD
jgi:hypothetical protein